MKRRLSIDGPLLRAAALAAVLAASASAQIRSAPAPVLPAGLSAPSAAVRVAAPVGAAPALAPSFASAAPSLPAAAPALAAAPEAAPAAGVPAALAASLPGAAAAPAADSPSAGHVIYFDGAPAKQTVLGDPALTDAALKLVEPVWIKLPRTVAAVKKTAFRRALEAADYTGAREVLEETAADAREILGSAYRTGGLAFRLERAVLALNAPDHPAVASFRAGLAGAAALKEAGKPSRAMEAVAKLLADYHTNPISRTEHRFAFSMPLLQLKSELLKYGSASYFNYGDARELKLRPTVEAVDAWVKARRAADPANVAGAYEPQPIPTQRWSDCALQSIWNLPAVRVLRSRFVRYEDFVTFAENDLHEPIRSEGLHDGDSRRLLNHLGYDRSYDRDAKTETDLVGAIGPWGGVLASYDFKMSWLTALVATGSFKRTFGHAVAIPAAVYDRGRWWFIVLDSGYSQPRVLTYGELLTMGLKFATVKPLP